MVCMRCGTELEEGKMYCPVCGLEIQIVPDFEPEIEEQINDVLGDITDELIRSEKEEKKEIRLEQEEKRRRKIRLLSAVAAILLVLLFFGGFFWYRHIDSVETLLSRAQAAAQGKDYERAAECMLRAVELDGTDMDIRNLLGRYYLLAGENQNARTTFQDVIAIDRGNEEAYRNLIGIYEKEGDYAAINELIRSSDSNKIVNAFSKYIANPPQFSHEQGTYGEMISLKLTANAAGTIYYTLDGSEPDRGSEVYTTPILLEDGIHTVRAFFVNAYGIQSETAVQIYQIHLSEAHEPQVEPASGSYTQPQMITVTVPEGERVYYTVDGSEPTMDSIPYHNPIAMPIGGSTYRFISYHADGVSSEVVTRDYAFALQSSLDLESAVNLLVVGLMEKGVITDVYCSVPGRDGRNLYVCSSAITINQSNYYLIVEYYEDPAGTNTRTGNLYCVDAETGGLYTASLDEEGHYSVVSLG